MKSRSVGCTSAVRAYGSTRGVITQAGCSRDSANMYETSHSINARNSSSQPSAGSTGSGGVDLSKVWKPLANRFGIPVSGELAGVMLVPNQISRINPDKAANITQERFRRSRAATAAISPGSPTVRSSDDENTGAANKGLSESMDTVTATEITGGRRAEDLLFIVLPAGRQVDSRPVARSCRGRRSPCSTLRW